MRRGAPAVGGDPPPAADDPPPAKPGSPAGGAGVAQAQAGGEGAPKPGGGAGVGAGAGGGAVAGPAGPARGGALSDSSEEVVVLVQRLFQIWTALGVPEAQRGRFEGRHRVDAPAGCYRSLVEIEKGVKLWTEAAEAVLKREEAVLELVAFEEHSMAPERLLDRRPSSAIRRPASARNNAEGASGEGRQAAWLLRESKQRDQLHLRITALETKLMVVMARLEATGEALWFQGQPYREKMGPDQHAMLQQVAEHS